MDTALARKWLRHYAVFRPLSRLPLPMAYAGADRIGRLDRQRQQGARSSVAAAMSKAFPELDRDPALRNNWLDRYFAMLAREMLDTYRMPRITPANGAALVNIAPGTLELLRQKRHGGRGVIIAMSHYSRLNMLLLGLALHGEKLGMLTMVTDHRNPYLDAVERPYLDRKIRTLLQFIGGRWVSLADNLRALYQALEAGETMVILFDAYTPERPQSRLLVPFLGGSLQVSPGLARLAAKTGAAVLYGAAHQRGYRIEAELRELPAQVEQILPAAAAELERDLRQAPWAWWQWSVLDLIWAPAGGPRPMDTAAT